MIVIVCLFILAIAYYVHFRRSRKLLYELSGRLLDVGDMPILGHSLWFIGGPESKFAHTYRSFSEFDFLCQTFFILNDLLL